MTFDLRGIDPAPFEISRECSARMATMLAASTDRVILAFQRAYPGEIVAIIDGFPPKQHAIPTGAICPRFIRRAPNFAVWVENHGDGFRIVERYHT